MNLISLESFAKDVKALRKKYKNIKEDLTALKEILSADPKAGVELGRDCYKVRLANSSIPAAKSGGFRIIYYYVDDAGDIYLMAIYSKTELDNISDARILDILKENGFQ